MTDLTVFRTPAPGCPACEYRTRHTDEEWKVFHPDAGHGYRKGTGWSKPGLAPPEKAE
jgi:hypothetical protein